MLDDEPVFCGRCKAELDLERETCPNCGAWIEAVTDEV